MDMAKYPAKDLFGSIMEGMWPKLCRAHLASLLNMLLLYRRQLVLYVSCVPRQARRLQQQYLRLSNGHRLVFHPSRDNRKLTLVEQYITPFQL